MVWDRPHKLLPLRGGSPEEKGDAVVTKIDLKKELKRFYAPSAAAIAVVNVPEFNFAMIDGYMEPSERPATSVAFQNAIAALSGVSFSLKSISKQRARNPVDYAVMALEALWWVDSGNFDFQASARWRWTLNGHAAEAHH